jgi:repressor LexA
MDPAVSGSTTAPSYTDKQGQYLAFVHTYTVLHGRPPAQTDMQRYFKVTAPSVHQMVVTLERRGLISRVPRQARTIKVLLPPAAIPLLASLQAPVSTDQNH